MSKSPAGPTIRVIEEYPDVGMGVVQGDNSPDFGEDIRTAIEERGSSTLAALADKLIVVGDPSVGKTSLIVRFCRGHFVENYKATVGVDFMYERFMILNSTFTLHIWDTAGQEHFKSITQAYYRGAKGVIVAFDLNSTESLSNVRVWAEEARRHVGQDCFVWLVGLKSDLPHYTTTAQGCSLAEDLGAEYWEASSKTGANVNELFSRVAAILFESAVRRIVHDEKKEESSGTIGSLEGLPSDRKKPARDGGCC